MRITIYVHYMVTECFVCDLRERKRCEGNTGRKSLTQWLFNLTTEAVVYWKEKRVFLQLFFSVHELFATL